MLRQRGMSIVELIVAMAIGTIISAALAAIFVTTTKMKHEINRMGEQIENGRLAMDWLSKDIGVAGFWEGLEFTGMADPSVPGICDSSDSALKAAVPVYIQGVDNVTAAPSCLADVKLGTDIVVVRRAGTCIAGVGGCESVAPYFQASSCAPPADKLDGTSGTVALGQELGSTDKANWYGVASTTAALTLHKRDCGNATVAGTPNLAAIRRYIARIYFVANNDRAGDGLPSLKMAELRGTTWTISTIASGIEQLHIEYGQDTGGDTTAESYVAAPAAVAAWRQIVAVKIHLLSRNSSASPEYTDRKVYVLGGNEYCASRALSGNASCTELGSSTIRRHSFSGQVGIRNPVGLRGG